MSRFELVKLDVKTAIGNEKTEAMVQEVLTAFPEVTSAANQKSHATLFIADLCGKAPREIEAAFHEEKADYCILILNEDGPDLPNCFETGTQFVLRPGFRQEELKQVIQTLLSLANNAIQNQLLNRINDGAHNTIVITSKEGVIEYANDFFLKATGYDMDALLGGLPKLIKSGVHDARFYSELWETIRSGKVWEGFFVNRNKSGGLFYEEATITPIFDAHGEVVNFLKIGKCVERERLLSNELDHEVRRAKDLLSGMLPQYYEDENLVFDAALIAYNYLGGDFISFERCGPQKYFVALIDVMGHGASSTLVGLKAITLFQAYSRYVGLEQAVEMTNREVVCLNHNEKATSRYLTGIFLELDLEKGFIRYISAGHPEFMTLDAQGNVTAHYSNNILIGVTDKQAFEAADLKLSGLRQVFMCSDGLIENPEVAWEVTQQKLKDVLPDASQSPKTYLEQVHAHMLGESEIKDDLTLCFIQFKQT